MPARVGVRVGRMLAVGVEVEEELTTPSVGAVMEVEVEVDSLGGVGDGTSLGMGASVASGRAPGQYWCVWLGNRGQSRGGRRVAPSAAHHRQE